MNDVLRKIYELYFEDEYYMEQLLNDKDYTKISKKLNQQEKELSLLYKTKCNENIDKILNDFFNSYMSISNTYRYFDFINGLTLGIALATSPQLVHNQKLIDKCINMVNQLNDN